MLRRDRRRGPISIEFRLRKAWVDLVRELTDLRRGLRSEATDEALVHGLYLFCRLVTSIWASDMPGSSYGLV